MKKIVFYLILTSSISCFSKVLVYFNHGTFGLLNSQSYLETYITVSGNSVKYLKKSDFYQASVFVSWKILKGNEVVQKLSYNLFSTKISDTINKPSFIDNQRFLLANGEYTLQFETYDRSIPEQKTTYSEKITIQYVREKKINTSSIQILESYTKTTHPTNISKCGFDLVPYNINYFPKGTNGLKFYLESYNADTLLGTNSKFIYFYFIENSETLSKINNLVGFNKQKAEKINPLLGQFNITSLPTGNYNLVIELRDSLNTLQSQKKWFFQRQGSAEEIPENNFTNSLDAFFNSFQSTDTLKQFIECLWPISKTVERTWQQTQIESANSKVMQNYLIDFWKSKAGDSLNAFNLWKDYYKEVNVAKAMFKCGKQKGYYTDRGRVYLQYGKPEQRNQVASSADTYPYEIWQYYRIYDHATGRFFTNKKFVFANFAIADDCYDLIYSDVIGEMNDPNWKYRLVKRTQPRKNVDDNDPAKNFGNNFDDNFLNPK
jgi:GWxTD domain-containing protein